MSGSQTENAGSPSPGGVQRTRSFDASGRLAKEEGSGAEASTAIRDLTYDLAGRPATTSSLDGVNTYTYNDRGMLLRADGPSGTSTHGYDADGQLTQRIDAAGTADFTYLNGRPATVTDPVTRTLQTLGYNTAGQLSLGRCRRQDTSGVGWRRYEDERIDAAAVAGGR
ncbi:MULTISPECIES: hypothetical protein [unclassified Kribbella]|uniref:hypothetical protein n=1 Tax=unclassified Kribbella TaxID=2644121 RepID=UPI00301B3D19